MEIRKKEKKKRGARILKREMAALRRSGPVCPDDNTPSGDSMAADGITMVTK